MKSYLRAAVVFSILVIFGCATDGSGIEPTLHDSIEIDLDEDGFADYSIEYSYVDIDPLTISGGTFGIVGSLKPNGRNEILRKSGSKNLFLRDLKEVKENVTEPLSWKSSFSRSIVSISTINREGAWPNKWEVNSDSNHSSYFLGLKLVTDIDSRLAWLEIEINTNDGSVSIVDKGIL